MKKAFALCSLFLSILCLVSCVSEKDGRYGGTDINGLTADAVVKECYEFFEKMILKKPEAFH